MKTTNDNHRGKNNRVTGRKFSELILIISGKNKVVRNYGSPQGEITGISSRSLAHQTG